MKPWLLKLLIVGLLWWQKPRIVHAGAPIQAAWDQDSYRARNDDGSESAATWKATANTAWTQTVDELFRLRLLIQQTVSNANANLSPYFVLQFRHQPFGGSFGSWTNVPAPATGNLITNTGFETDTSGWAAVTADTTIARSTEQAHSGSASLKATVGVATNAPRVRTDGISFVEGSIYTVRLWVYVPTAYGGTDLHVARFSSTGGATALAAVNLSTRDAWQEVVTSFTAPADIVGVGVAEFIEGAIGDFIYIDDAFAGIEEAETNYADSANLTHGGATTQQVGAGSFVAGDIYEQPSTATTSFTSGALSETEHEFSLILNSALVGADDVLEFRVVRDGSTLLDTYTNTPSLTASAAGGGGVSGSIASTLTPLTSALQGTQTQSGSIASTLAPLTASLSGKQVQSGAIASTLAPLTAAFLGEHTSSGISGSVASTLTPVTSALQGKQTQLGDISSSLAPLTSSLSGTAETESIIGNIGATLTVLTASFQGVMLPEGTIGASLTPLTASLQGAAEVNLGQTVRFKSGFIKNAVTVDEWGSPELGGSVHKTEDGRNKVVLVDEEDTTEQSAHKSEAGVRKGVNADTPAGLTDSTYRYKSKRGTYRVEDV